MENGLFSSDEFSRWSEKFIPYVHISTRLDGQKHEGLFRELGFTGFPTLAFLDAGGLLIAKHTGSRSVEPLQQTADQAVAYLALRQKAAGGDLVAAQQLFVADLELMRYGFAQASLIFATLRKQMPRPLRKKVRQRLIDVQYQELRGELTKKFRDGLAREDYSRQCTALNAQFLTAGRLPTGRNGKSLLSSVLRAAYQQKDSAAYASALEKYRTNFGSEARAARTLKYYEKQLAELRGDQ